MHHTNQKKKEMGKELQKLISERLEVIREVCNTAGWDINNITEGHMKLIRKMPQYIKLTDKIKRG